MNKENDTSHYCNLTVVNHSHEITLTQFTTREKKKKNLAHYEEVANANVSADSRDEASGMLRCYYSC